MKKLLSCLAAALLVLAIGCGDKGGPEPGGKKGDAKKPLVVGFSQIGAESD
ncbi:LacI family transcriptional regulator, partial [bacterium]|nr:LacI family transcriptional regulator [bacterium]